MEEIQLGFLLHAIVETPAAIMFFIRPSRQLGVYTPSAHVVIRQYALLLLTSVLIASIFILRPPDKLSGQVAGALAVYHIGPCLRSLSQLISRGGVRESRSQTQPLDGPSFFEPVLYAVAHAVTGVLLASNCWTLCVLQSLPAERP